MTSKPFLREESVYVGRWEGLDAALLSTLGIWRDCAITCGSDKSRMRTMCSHPGLLSVGVSCVSSPFYANKKRNFLLQWLNVATLHCAEYDADNRKQLR